VIVNYNTANLLQFCLKSIEENCNLNYAIVVVDNNSTDNSCQMIKQQFPQTMLIQNDNNLGYPTAVNQGINAIPASFYFILNSDVILQNDTAATLYKYISQKPEVGIVAPAQRLPNGDPILSIYKFPNLKREWMRNLLFTDIITFRNRGQKLAAKIKNPLSVDWVMGSAMFVRAEVIADIGLMDENIFMYGEELDWCLRAKSTDWEIHYLPEAKIIHYESASADKAFSAGRYERVVRSNYYVFMKHFGSWKLPFFVAAQCLGSILRIIVSTILYFFGQKSYYDQLREHQAVLRISINPGLYKRLKSSLEDHA